MINYVTLVERADGNLPLEEGKNTVKEETIKRDKWGTRALFPYPLNTLRCALSFKLFRKMLKAKPRGNDTYSSTMVWQLPYACITQAAVLSTRLTQGCKKKKGERTRTSRSPIAPIFARIFLFARPASR